MNKRHLLLLFFNRYRTPIVICVLLLLVTVYALLSGKMWIEYSSNYRSWQASTRMEVDKAFLSSAITESERAHKLAKLEAISETITQRKDLICQSHYLINWQQIVPGLRAKSQSCQQVRDDISDFNKEMQTTLAFLENEQALTKMITAAIPSDTNKISEDVWGKQALQWRDIGVSVKRLEVSSSFQPVKDIALEKSGLIETAWRSVITANQAKNKTQYIEAQSNLTHAYESLESITSTSTKRLTALSSSLRATYDRAFLISK